MFLTKTKEKQMKKRIKERNYELSFDILFFITQFSFTIYRIQENTLLEREKKMKMELY